MSVPASLTPLVGRWQGTKQVWLHPGAPVRASETTAVVNLIAQGRFLTIQYTWSDENQPQDGLLTIGTDSQAKQTTATWVDSWHMDEKFQICTDAKPIQGIIAAKGFYQAPPGPDWGWQIEIATQSPDTFQLIMYNFPPEGEGVLAVQADYRRVK